MARRLSFYDHHRQRYHDATWRPEHDSHVGEFNVGDYVRDGGVDRRGELGLSLYRFSHGASPFLPERPDEFLSVKIECFTDGLGALRALEFAGVLDAISSAKLRDRDDLARLLIAHGLRDLSDERLARAA